MKKSAIVCGKVLFGLLVVLTVVFPIYMIVSNSFKPTLLIRKMPPQFFFPPTLQHYVKILKQGTSCRILATRLSLPCRQRLSVLCWEVWRHMGWQS